MNSVFAVSVLASTAGIDDLSATISSNRAGKSAARTEPMMGNLPFAVTTPVSVSRVGLRARDAEKLAAYYRAVVGLEELSRGELLGVPRLEADA